MSPPRGGDSWKWSDTENQSNPFASANFHSLRISSSGPPMAPMWIPKFISRSCETGERPVCALRALERGEIGGGPARRFDGQRDPCGKRRDQLRQRQDALAGQGPAGAGLTDQGRRVGRAGHVGRSIADLRVAEKRRVHLLDVSRQSAGAAEAQSVDQDRRVRALRLGQDARGVGERPHAGVDREFQAHVKIELCRAIAELAEPVDRARLVGLGAHDEDVPGAQARRDLEKALGHALGPVGLEAEELRVEHAHAGVRQPEQGLAQDRAVAEDVVRRHADARRGGQPDADRPKAGGGRHRDQLRWRRVQYGEVGQRDRSTHQSSSSTQYRGSALTKTSSPSLSGSDVARRTTSTRPSHSTWYCVKSPWNTRRRIRARQTLTDLSGGRVRSSRRRTVRTAINASSRGGRPDAVPCTKAPPGVWMTTSPLRSRSGRRRPRIRLAEPTKSATKVLRGRS